MLVEVTCRTIQSRFLLRPGKRLNEIFIGCLAKARSLYPVAIHGVVAASNHFHLLVSPTGGDQLANFMRHLNGNLSKEVGRLHDWRGPMFDRRYRSIPITDEATAQIARLRYLLSHGAKEGMVLSPGDWPGVNSVAALLAGKPLAGTWFDRSAEYLARQKGESPGPRDHATAQDTERETLPCWQHLAAAEIRRRVRDLVEGIEQETLARHAAQGTEPAGARAARKVHPHSRPGQSKRTPAPRFHAWAGKQRRKLEDGYRDFLVAFREAAKRLRDGDRLARFPEGCFPPALPFVPRVESFAPG